jgi:hypothetical protein
MSALTDRHMLDAYEGAGGFGDGSYLVQHTRESDTDYARRQAVATYRNYVAKVVDAYVDTVFAQPAQRSGEAAAWQELQGNADGIGGQIDDLMSAALVLSMLVSPAYLVVDRPPGVSRTRADDAQRRPYVVVREPGSVASLTLDRLGAVERVVFAEAAQGLTFGVGAAAPEVVYRGWDRQRWWVARDAQGRDLVRDAESGEPLAGTHGLGRPPVVRLFSRRPLRRLADRAPAWALGIVAAGLDLYNRHSEARAIERDQTVSTLALPVTDLAEADRIREVGITVGTSNAVLYNPAGGGRPGYFAPPADPLKQLYQAIDSNITQIYAMANLEFVGGVQQSGAALSFHFANANRTLAGFAARCELVEVELGRLACAWLERDGQDIRVVYPKSFQIEDLKARLEEDMDALTMSLGATADRLIRGRAARRVLGDSAGPDDYGQIDRDLKQGADPYKDRITKEGGTPPPEDADSEYAAGDAGG